MLGMGAVWFMRDRVLSLRNGDTDWQVPYIRMKALVVFAAKGFNWVAVRFVCRREASEVALKNE